jgi:hypothetical protein
MENILVIWEKLWSSPHVNLHIFFAFAIFNAHRFNLLKQTAFDEILKYVNNLALKHHLDEMMARMVILRREFELLMDNKENRTAELELLLL